MKKTRTLSSRLAIIFIGALSLGLLAGGITTYIIMDKIVDNLTNARLKNSVYKSSEPIVQNLISAESSVEDAEFTTSSYFTTSAQLSDKTYVNSSLEKIEDFYKFSATHYQPVCGYWLILNPTYTGLTPEAESGDGFFYAKNQEGTYVKTPVTNVLKYEETDTEHIGWWVAVKNNKQPVWTNPYYNANINKNMFSYVRPFFAADNTFLGAVGIDIDLASIIDYIDEYDEYKDAHPVLLDKDGKIIIQESVQTFDENGHFIGSDKTVKDVAGIDSFIDAESGAIIYKYEGHRRNAMSVELPNGFVYGISVRTGELRRPVRMVIFIPLLVYIGAGAAIVVLVYFMVRRHTKPLSDLNEAIEKIQKGRMDVVIEAKHHDEIGQLATSFQKMVASIKEKNKIISAMAYLDGLTGVKNKNAHRETVKRLDQEIQEGRAKFAVVMLDVNNLKIINDNIGHDGGDRIIIGSCYSLCKAFSHSPVYRIGGDEFVAIVEGEDYENRQEIYEKLVNNEIEVKKQKYDYAVGMATYEPGIDKSFHDVFTRADQEMYINKKARKNNE